MADHSRRRPDRADDLARLDQRSARTRTNAQGSASRLAAVAGYPHLTVPMGFDRGMPVGISFIGGKWDDARILSLGHAFEQKTQARRAPGMVSQQE